VSYLAKGFGIWMDLRTFTADELHINIQLILTGGPNNYTDAVGRASAILRDRPDGGAAKRVSDLVNHVIRHGDSHLRTGAFKMSDAQFFMIDIFMFLAVVAVLVLALFGLCVRCLCRGVSGKCGQAWMKLSGKEKKMQ